MDNKIEKILKEEFLVKGSKKIDEQNLHEYLNSLKKEELIRFIAIYPMVSSDNKALKELLQLNKKPKKDIVQYIEERLDKILKSYFKIIKTEEIKQLKIILKNNGVEFPLYELNISIHVIDLLKRFSLAKVDYNLKKDSIKFFIPSEYVAIFNRFFKNKKIMDENRRNSEIYDYFVTIINTYGVVPLKKFYELFEKQMFKIEKDELENVIMGFSFNEEFYCYRCDDDELFCNIDFYEMESALDFYNEQKGDYKEYSKKEYEMISDFSYVDGLKSYQKLVDYLCRNYIDISKDIDYIKDFLVIDYISSAQLSKEIADKNFRINAVKILDVDNRELEYLLKLVRNVFCDYPKWIKGGRV